MVNARWLFLRVAVNNHLQLPTQDAHAIPWRRAALHVAHHVAAYVRTHLIQVLLGPGLQVATQAAGVGRFGIGAHTGQGDVGEQY